MTGKREIYFDQLNQKIFYNPIKGKFKVPNNDQDTKLKLQGEKTKFELFIKSNTFSFLEYFLK